MYIRGVSRTVGVADLCGKWMVIRTKPRQERVAMKHLGQRGVEGYCPMYLEPSWSRRAANRPVPMFTGYIFTLCTPDLQPNAVFYCPGVAHPVRFEGRPATVEQAIVDELRRREGERGFVMPPEIEIGIKLGAKVMVMAGPLSGMEGIFRGYMRGGERAQVLLEFLRRQNLVEVDTEALAAVRR